jgi:DNA-binding MarR family transcriptional regulator
MMNINDLRKEKISYSLLRVIYKFFDIDRKTRYYGTDQPLFYSEIHVIRALKENQGIHVTGLAQKLGVTKGAVSQIIIKLEKKGLIQKEKALDNQSRLVLKLTPEGEVAQANHEKFHQKFDSLINAVLQNVSAENQDFLKDFLTDLEGKLEGFETEFEK